MPSMRKKNFTLIELLTVVAIAAVLIAIMAPAFNRMLFGNKVDQCISALKLGMEMAQAKAVSARKYVAMVLPGDYDSVSDAKLKKFVAGGYRLAYLKKESNESFTFISWIPDEPWRNPADGAMLVNVADTAAGAVVDTTRSTGSQFTKLAAFSGTDDDLTAFASPRALIFSPYGGLANDGTTTLYFVVTEASVEGGAYRFPNSDDKLVLKINPITGRVSELE